ncbi:molybdopterin-dependent oxidoreductase [Gordonibacter urolithinfaciens]|uniref:molybdopterin-dependent oxidoreductase n=1 Tax=Gordonibacter urolithinfaciens TaxID=1335613 RepID=UPI003A954D07
MAENEYLTVPHEKPYKYQEGDLTVTRGSAWTGPGCHLGCGVLLYTDDDGKLVKVEGDPENPYNDGRLCVRCLALPEVTNHKDRLLYPMKRDPKDRGKDKWERMSWDEAIDLVAGKLIEIRDKYGAETVIFGQGTGRDISSWITRLAWSYGSPNYTCFALSGLACYLPRVAGMAATCGGYTVADCSQQFPDRYDNPNWRCPELMVLWGNYPLRANSDGFYGHWMIDLMKRGMKIMMVDPRVTWLSLKAEAHLRLRPGTDAALALGMMNVIINEDLYDHDFVEKWTYGFDELAERVQEYPPSKVAEITWVPEEEIKSAARMLASAKPAAMQWGLAVDMVKEALPAGQAIVGLFQITGNVDVPGGNIFPVELIAYSGGWGGELISEEQKAKRIGLDTYPLLALGFQVAQTDELMKTMLTDKPYKMRGIWLQTNNAIACMGAEPKMVLEALLRLEFNVVVDLFMTPTAMACADVVLPAATYPEKDGLRLGDGLQRGEVINKVCQIGEAKSDAEINLMLGKRLNPEAWPWDSIEDMLSSMIATTGMTFPELREQAPLYLPFEYKRYETGKLRADGQPGFNTATGRIELWSTFYNQCGLDPMPYFDEPNPGPGATPELMDEYPFVLTTGARRWSSFHSEHRQLDRLRRMDPWPYIEIHPDTAAELGFVDGEWVWVENQMGRAKRTVKITPIVDPRVVSCDHGWWLPEKGPENLYDVFVVNINNLVPMACGKSGFGANYKTSICKLYKVEKGE